MKLTSDEQIYSLKSVAEVRDTFSQQDVSGITGNSLKNEYYVTEHNGYTEMYKICSSDTELKEFSDNTLFMRIEDMYVQNCSNSVSKFHKIFKVTNIDSFVEQYQEK